MAEAVSQVGQAVDLDPLSPQINTDWVLAYLFAGRHAEAAEQGQKAVDLDPSYARAHAALALAREAQHRWREGMEAIERGFKAAPQAPWLVGILGLLHGGAGDALSARECERRLKALSRRIYVSPMWFALIHLGLNEKDRFFEAMNAACDDRAPWLRYLNRDPFFRALLPTIGFKR